MNSSLMKMSRRRQSVSSAGVSENGRKGPAGSDNLHVSLSMSPSNFPKTVRRELPRSEKSRSVPTETKSTKRMPLIVQTRPRSGAVTSGIPEDVAVHFGNFYDQGALSTKGGGCRDTRTTKSEFPACETPRSEFTGQMVHESSTDADGDQKKKVSEDRTAMNTLGTMVSGNRRTVDLTDCENNDESSSASSSELTSVSDAKTEDDSDNEGVKVAIVVN